MKVIDVKFKSKREISKIIEKNKLIEKNKNIIGENNFEDNNNNNNSENMMDIDKEDEIIEITKDVIMEIFCTFKEEGLGPLEWWN
jgi:hypothetical protein